MGTLPASAAPAPGPVAKMTPPVHPEMPVHPATAAPAAPEVPSMTAPANGDLGIKPMELPKLDFKERQALPSTSPGVLPGSPGFYEGKIEKLEDQKANPLGSPENHPGFGGKLAHTLGLVGNIVGNATIPGTMEMIPGTQLNKGLQENAAESRLETAKKEETAGAVEKTREKHEENVEDTNQKKIDQAQQKIDETENKDRSTREVNLRKQGLKLNPDDPNATPIPLAYEDMSPTEQAVHDLKVAQADSQTAKAALDQVKADPNSPQNKATLERIKIMAQNAGTAAGKLGLDKKKFLADYFGTDENGDPLPGTAVDPKTGKPIGVKVSGKGGEQFVGTIGASVVQATATQDSVRRLMSILEPNKNDNAPFGSFWKQIEYKFGKAQSDQIGQELASINLASLQQAATVLKGMGGVRAVQALNKALQHTPDPTKDSVALMYQKMENIDRSLATFLEDADKYGRKKPTTIEPERMKPRPAGGTPKPEETKPAAGAPAPPKVGDIVDGHRFKGGDPSKKESWEKAAAPEKK